MIIIGQVNWESGLEKYFEVAVNADQTIEPRYLIKHDRKAWVITSANKHEFKSFNYGMVPFWSKRPLMHYEAPVEGDTIKGEGITNLKKRIILHPSYRKPIRESRCVIPADYIIVDSHTGQSILLRNTEGKPLVLAGVYDNWKAHISDVELYQGFSILTVPCSDELRTAGINRLPLFIAESNIKHWLRRESLLTDITALMRINEVKDMDAYPVDPLKVELDVNSKELIRPTGEHLLKIKKSDFGFELGKLLRFRHR